MRGRFITLEGVEGTGKSTHLEFVAQFLRARGKKALCTREPGGTPLGERVREILLANDLQQMDAVTELLLMFAARMEHVKKVIEPALQAGTWVISDRFYDASYAYQGFGRGVDQKRIAILHKNTIGDLEPDLTFLLDVSLEVSRQRVEDRGDQDRFEKENSEFYTNVRNGYLQLAEQHRRIRIIDANQTIQVVQSMLKHELEQLV